MNRKGIVAGLDTSLTGTGLVVLGAGEPLVWTIGTKPTKSERISVRYDRLNTIVEGMLDGLNHADPGFLVIEQPAYGSTTGKVHDRAGLWWLCVRAAQESGWTVAGLPIKTRQKYATGTGNAPKDAVMLAASRRYAEINITNNNEADATILAAIGRRYLGLPIEVTDLTKPQMDAYYKAATTWKLEGLEV